MKIILSFVFLFTSFSVLARNVLSSPRGENKVPVARIVELVKLVDKSDLKVNIAIHDLGGSTDVSPTQELFFTLYAKGEMFSTDATFNLGKIYEFKSARRTDGGVYEVKVMGVDGRSDMPVAKTLMINAQEAIMDLKEVECDDFDCEASTNFKATIQVTEK